MLLTTAQSTQNKQILNQDTMNTTDFLKLLESFLLTIDLKTDFLKLLKLFLDKQADYLLLLLSLDMNNLPNELIQLKDYWHASIPLIVSQLQYGLKLLEFLTNKNTEENFNFGENLWLLLLAMTSQVRKTDEYKTIIEQIPNTNKHQLMQKLSASTAALKEFVLFVKNNLPS